MGPNNSLWFTDTDNNYIGQLSSGGEITQYPVPSPGNAGLWGIAAGPDDAVWFTEYYNSKIGRMSPTGQLTEYQTPTSDSGPNDIVLGPDNALWFTEEWGNIGRITTAGVITEYPIPGEDPDPLGITVGPDGALWFAEHAGRAIGRVTTNAAFAIYPTLSSGQASLTTTGPDGAIWFTEDDSNKFGRLTTSGVMTEYTVPTANTGPTGIVGGKDGNIWMTEFQGDAIAHAPACGIGLRLSYANTTLTLSFDLGVTSAGTFSAEMVTSGGTKQLFSKAIAATVPPQSFAVNAGPGFPYTGTVQVTATVAGSNNSLLCSESQSINVAP
jgi:virginiamycin B lyase